MTGYVLDRAGKAVERREIFVQRAGLVQVSDAVWAENGALEAGAANAAGWAKPAGKSDGLSVEEGQR